MIIFVKNEMKNQRSKKLEEFEKQECAYALNGHIGILKKIST